MENVLLGIYKNLTPYGKFREKSLGLMYPHLGIRVHITTKYLSREKSLKSELLVYISLLIILVCRAEVGTRKENYYYFRCRH